MHSPFTAGDRDQLRALLLGAGFGDPRILIGVIAVRFASVEEFLRQEAASSPLAGPVEALDGRRRDALLDDLRQALRPHADDGGIVFPMQTWLVTARR
jgi:hypothetical protein